MGYFTFRLARFEAGALAAFPRFLQRFQFQCGAIEGKQELKDQKTGLGDYTQI